MNAIVCAAATGSMISSTTSPSSPRRWRRGSPCRATLANGGDELCGVIEQRGQRLIDGFNEIGRRHGVPLHAQGLGTVFTTVFADSPPLVDYRDYQTCEESLRLRLVHAVQDEGVRTAARGTSFMSAVHTDSDIDATLHVAAAAAAAL